MDEPTENDQVAITTLIEETYAAISDGDPGTSRFFAHPDIAIAGSGRRTGPRPSSGATPTDGHGVTGAGQSHRRSHGFRDLTDDA
jgi:hypothetical protein